jgi:DNA mismatch repair protein MutL
MCADCQRRAVTNPLRVFDCKVPEDQPIIETLPTHQPVSRRRLPQALRRSKANPERRRSPLRSKPRWCGDWIITPAPPLNSRMARWAHRMRFSAADATTASEALGGPPAPGIGFAIGEDRLVLALNATAESQSSVSPTSTSLRSARDEPRSRPPGARTAHGPHPRPLRKRCQQDRRRRSGGAPASVVKELLENSLDAGATRIRMQVEAGGKKLIQITDNGCGMVRDDAMLAFERHATSKIKNAEDLLSVATLGFRGRRCPRSPRSPACTGNPRPRRRLRNDHRDQRRQNLQSGRSRDCRPGTSITIRDLFFNTPARKKFLKAESTELSHIASLVTHYALAHPDKHFELHSATNAMLVAPPVAGYSERVYQVFGKEVLDQLIPIAAVQPLNASACRNLRPGAERKKARSRAPANKIEIKIRTKKRSPNPPGECGCTVSSPSRKSRS